jgi:hypothetical protein
MLDHTLLAALEARWRDLGTTMDQRMRPGLSDTDIDRITAPLAFPVPEEVRLPMARRLRTRNDDLGTWDAQPGAECYEHAPVPCRR